MARKKPPQVPFVYETYSTISKQIITYADIKLNTMSCKRAIYYLKVQSKLEVPRLVKECQYSDLEPLNRIKCKRWDNFHFFFQLLFSFAILNIEKYCI